MQSLQQVEEKLATMEKPVKTSNVNLDELIVLIEEKRLHFSSQPVEGREEIQSTLVSVNDIVRLCEYLKVEGNNPLQSVRELRDLPHIEIEFAVMAETGKQLYSV